MTVELDRTEVPDYASLLRLDGKRYVVVGAGQGIGRQVSHALAAVGARVLCADLEPERAEQVAAETGGVPWAGDVTSREDVRRLFATAGGERAGLGGLDGVVDIVGMARWQSLLEADDDNWRWHHDIVLRHAYLVVQHAADLLAGGGPLVFVASVSGLSSAPMHAAYGVAKAGLMSLVRTAAVELGPRGIRVNAVAPGMVWTPRISVLTGERAAAAQTATTPLRRLAHPRDIAAALLFLASPLAGYVTGQTLVVDGGKSVVFPYTLPEGTEASSDR